VLKIIQDKVKYREDFQAILEDIDKIGGKKNDREITGLQMRDLREYRRGITRWEGGARMLWTTHEAIC